MTPTQFFEEAINAGKIPQDANLQASYQYGGLPDELAQLVKTGTKTATSSALDLYEDDEPLPQKGAYDVILDSQNQPVCIIKNDEVSVEKYLAVGPEHAFLEGEGDRTLAYWRQVHNDFFEREYRRNGQVFNPEDTEVVLELFHVVYTN